MQDDLVWDDLRYFLAIVRAHSLTDAGRHLGVSPSTVSRWIDTLEQVLGRRLFRRRRDGYALTPAGGMLVADAEAAEARILSLQRNAGAEPADPAGVVRLATPELLAHELIIPHLGDILEAYPTLCLELLSNVHPVSLAREEADIIVRAVRPTQGAYTARRITRVGVGLFASDTYLARYGMPASPADLAGHRLITWDRDLAFLKMAGWVTAIAEEASVALRTTTYTAQLAACRAGCGLAALPIMIGEKHALRRVPLGLSPLLLDLWLIVRTDLRVIRRVEVVCDFLINVLSCFNHTSGAAVNDWED